MAVLGAILQPRAIQIHIFIATLYTVQCTYNITLHINGACLNKHSVFTAILYEHILYIYIYYE